MKIGCNGCRVFCCRTPVWTQIKQDLLKKPGFWTHGHSLKTIFSMARDTCTVEVSVAKTTPVSSIRSDPTFNMSSDCKFHLPWDASPCKTSAQLVFALLPVLQGNDSIAPRISTTTWPLLGFCFVLSNLLKNPPTNQTGFRRSKFRNLAYGTRHPRRRFNALKENRFINSHLGHVALNLKWQPLSLGVSVYWFVLNRPSIVEN